MDRQHYFFPILMILILLSAVLIQSRLLLNVDTSWLAEASRRMLAGGTYTKDFFENNPPWVLYFYLPPVVIGKFFSLSIIWTMRIYIFTLGFISWGITTYLIHQIIPVSEAYLAKIFSIVFALLIFIIPVYDFSQREHLFFILTMPYLLLLVCRLQNIKIKPRLLVLIGLLAGSVFLLKPYFLMTLFLVETYYSIVKKNIFSWIRLENSIILLLLLIYFFILIDRHLDYLTVVIPHVSHWCYLGTKRPWLYLISNAKFSLCIFSIIIFINSYEINRHRQLTMILLIALVGFLLSYLVQQVDYPYRILPAFSMSILLSTLLFCIYLTTARHKKYFYLMILPFLFSILAIIILLNGISYYPIENPLFFFFFISLLLIAILFLFSREQQITLFNYFKIFTFPLLLGLFVFYVGMQFFNWSTEHVIFTMMVLIGSFSFLLPGTIKEKFNYLIVNTVCVLFFLIPVELTYLSYKIAKKDKQVLSNLIHYLDRYAKHQSVYFFNTNLLFSFPLLDYTMSTFSASRFSGFWLLAGFIREAHFPMTMALQNKLIEDKNFLINMIVDDIEEKKPLFVFIDTADKKNTLFVYHNEKMSYIPFDYLKFFGTNPKFINAWKNYHYLTTVVGYSSDAVNPLKYKLQLLYSNVPDDNEIKENMLYLYKCSDNRIEIALMNKFNEVYRLQLTTEKNNLSQSQWIAINNVLSHPGSLLNNQTKQAFFSWIAKQEIAFIFYKFQVYVRYPTEAGLKYIRTIKINKLTEAKNP